MENILIYILVAVLFGGFLVALLKYYLAHKKLRELDLVSDTVSGGIVRIVINGSDVRIDYANEKFCGIAGINGETIAKSKEKPYFMCSREDTKKLLKRYKDRDIDFIEDISLKLGSEKEKYLDVALSAKKIRMGRDHAVYQCAVYDRTELTQALQRIKYEDERYRAISDISDEILYEYDLGNDSIIINEKFERVFGIIPPRNNFKDFILYLVYEEDLPFFKSVFDRIGEEINKFDIEFRMKNGKGDYVWVYFQGVIIYDVNGKPYKAIGKITNINKMKQEIEELKEKSSRDALTKLYNKGAIESIIGEYLESNPKSENALFMIDADNFKAINDNLGHIYGDAVLMELTSNLTKAFEGRDAFLGRVGGDEFIAMLKNVKSKKEAEDTANDICKAFRNSYKGGEGKVFDISASVGVASFPEDGKNFKELFASADIAAYMAKSRGKDRYEIYEPKMAKETISYKSDRESRNKDDGGFKARSFVYENIITNVIEMLLETKDIRSAINMILMLIGKNFGFDRILIFEKNQTSTGMSNTYEWCGDDTESIMYSLQNIPYNEGVLKYRAVYNAEGIFFCSGIEKIKDQMPEYYETLKKWGVKSVFDCEIVEQGFDKGTIACYNINEMKSWNSDTIKSLSMLSKLVGSYLLKLHTSERLAIENKISRAIIENQQIYAYIVDTESLELLYINPRTLEVFPNAKIGEPCYKTLKGLDEPCEKCPIYSMLPSSEINTTRYDANNMSYAITARRMKWSADRSNAAVICSSNITEFIEMLNYKDDLTGLPTLVKFKGQAEVLLADDTDYALVYTDLDKFKNVNDMNGYKVGDEILTYIGQILVNNIDEKDELVCRVTDDKFMYLIKYKGMEDFEARMNKIYDYAENIHSTLYSGINIILISGVYIIGKEDKNLNDMIDKANIARKTLKNSHKSVWTVYDTGLHDKVTKEKVIESKMLNALKNEEFAVYYQPKAFLKDNFRLAGAEALVRWIQPNGGVVSPDKFIPIFERNGFIEALDFYVYEHVFQDVRRWLDNGLEVVPISINISRNHLRNPNFVKELNELMAKYNVPVDKIELELTESMFMDSMDIIIEDIREFKQHGFRISIDDFGAAYSSLNMLKSLPVDIIKLDKEFLGCTETDTEKERIIIKHVIKMAKDLNFVALCEGVETLEQVEFLKEANCDIIQGYYFHRPLPREQFETLLPVKEK